jgi:O-antigen ligase
MRAALERSGVEAGRAAPVEPAVYPSLARVPAAFLLGLAIVVAAAVFAGGGSSDAAVFPIGVGASALALAAVGAALAGAIPRPRVGNAGAAALVLLGALVVWMGVSVVWSIAPDRSWAYANRGLAYLAFLALGVVAGALARRAPSIVAAGLGVFVAAALAWALAGKIAPGLAEDGGRIARLRVPVGYWNSLALLFALGLPIALWLASEPRHRHALRAAAVAFLAALGVGIVLTYSRGGLIAATAAVVVWLALTSHRLQSVAALAVAAPFAAGVLVLAFRLSGIVDDGQGFAARSADGKVFGLAVGVALVAAFGAGYGASLLDARVTVSEERRRRVARGLVRAAIGAAVAGVVAFAIAAGPVTRWLERQADAFANPPTELVTQDPSRFTSLSSNNRWSWWNEAWKAFEARPLTGVGASSFPTAHRILRHDRLTATTPHDFPLQLLAEMGIVGLVLGGGAAAAALAGAGGALRRLRGPDRAAGAALACGIVAYVLHSLVDFDWDFLAVTAPVLVAAGVLLSAGRPSAPERLGLAWAAVPAALFACAVVSLGAPWLAERRVDAAYRDLEAGRPEAGLADANGARGLDPLALDPLLARASAQIALGDLEAARASLVRAIELQPLDSDAWYELGAFELDVGGQPKAAARYLERSLELDRFGPARPLLAQARAAAR